MFPSLLAISLAAAAAFAAAAPPVRLESRGPGIARIWLRPDGRFSRDRSLALADDAPAAGPVEASALRVRFDKEGRFSVAAGDGSPLLEDVRVSVSTSGAWTLSYPLSPEERLLGLGQDNRGGGRLDRRGTIRELWSGQQIHSGNVTAQYPVPFLLSTGRHGRAYGLFIDDVHRLRFDLGKTRKSELRLDADGGEIDIYVLDGPKPEDVIERYTALTGRPSLPPLWALGYWQSKCTYYDWNQLDEAYRQLTARGFPVDVMVIDADWPEIMTDYRWAKRWVPAGSSPAAKIAEYARKGVKIVMSQTGPMVKKEAPTFASGWAQGVFATDGRGHPVEAGWYGGELLDFTSPKMNGWLWPQTRRLVEEGIAGWWLDLTEPEGEPPQTRYHAGGPEDIHNQYSFLSSLSFEGVQLAVHPDRRPFILTRTGSAGIQRHHVAVWTGDIYSDYATLRAHPPEMLNSGISGLTWWTSDTGGFLVGDYKNDRFGAHARLYERWMQFSAFGPITRAHKAGGVPEPYGLGTATEQGTKHYLQLRYRLMPYIYSYAWEASRDGLPLVRALPLEFPDDPGSLRAPGDEYLFGRELLVAPVLYEGLSNRKVYFPPGEWIDWDYGYRYSGGRAWVVAAPQNRIPVAVRAGAIIPMAPPMRNTSEKPWDPLTLEVFPRGKSSFTLYRDDGATFDYQKGKYTVTHFESDEQPGSVRLTIEESNKLFAPKEYVVHWHLRRRPASVALDGKPLPGWTWDARSGLLTASFASSSARRREVSATLRGPELAAKQPPRLKADVIDPKAEASGSLGKPIPNFFPPPTLPALIKAVNYDKGGEGVAFHSLRPRPARPLYREDDFAAAETSDAGGGYVLSGLRTGEWMRYTVDAGNGGYFDLITRLAGRGSFRFEVQGQTIAVASATAEGLQDVVNPTVYLNPGEQTLLVSADGEGLSLRSFEFKAPRSAPTVYPAVLAARVGAVDAAPGGENGLGYVFNLGVATTTVTFGVDGLGGGERSLKLRYRNGMKKPVALATQIGSAPARSIELPPTGDAWKTFILPARLAAGGNRVELVGLEKGWDTVSLESLEVSR